MYCATVCFIVVSRRGMWALLCHWDMSGKCGLEFANPRRYHEWQADGCRPRNHVAVVEFQPDVGAYAMRVLRAHGTPTTSLHDIFGATILSRIQYAAPAWSGMCSAADRARLESLLRQGTTRVLRRRCADRRRPIRHRWWWFLADRTATQYDRLLASSCCPSVRLSVCLSVRLSVTLCIVALRVGVQR